MWCVYSDQRKRESVVKHSDVSCPIIISAEGLMPGQNKSTAPPTDGRTDGCIYTNGAVCWPLDVIPRFLFGLVLLSISVCVWTLYVCPLLTFIIAGLEQI